MSLEITIAPVMVSVSGETKVDRQMSVVRHSSGAALSMACSMKGKIGVAIRDAFSANGLRSVAQKAAAPTCDYRPFAEYLSIRTGKPITISGRAAFESMADRFADIIAECKTPKTKKDGSISNGYTLDSKGISKPTAKLAEAMDLFNICVAVREEAAALSKEYAERKQAEATAISE